MNQCLASLAIAVLAAGCLRPLTPVEQEIGDVALVAQYQSCGSKLRIWRRWGVHHYEIGTLERDGSVTHTHSTGYDIEACGTSVHLHTACSDRHGSVSCSFDVGKQELYLPKPPPRSRIVAEVIAVFDHAQRLFSCSFLEDEIRIERRADGPDAAYEVDACGAQRAFRVTCPDHGSIDPDDCHVMDR